MRALECLGWTLVPRLAVIGACLTWLPFSWERWQLMRDGARYLATARALAGGGLAGVQPGIAETQLTLPGYPLAIAALGAGIGPALAAVLINLTGAAAAVCLFRATFEDEAAARWFAIVPPAWILYTSMVMSEGLYLALIVAALFAAMARHRPVLAALCVSAALLVKLQAVIPALVLLWWIARREGRRSAARFAALLLVVPLGWLAFSAWRFGDPVLVGHQFAAYWQGGVLDWPLAGLLEGTSSSTIPLWKKLYVWAHVALVVGVCASGLRRWRTGPPTHRFATAWLVLNTAFQLCIGSLWGFHEFHRYLLPALPALVIVAAPVLGAGRRGPALAGLAGVGLTIAALAF